MSKVMSLDYFMYIRGFCTYVLVYHPSQIKAASDHRICIPRVLSLIKSHLP